MPYNRTMQEKFDFTEKSQEKSETAHKKKKKKQSRTRGMNVTANPTTKGLGQDIKQILQHTNNPRKLLKHTHENAILPNVRTEHKTTTTAPIVRCCASIRKKQSKGGIISVIVNN